MTRLRLRIIFSLVFFLMVSGCDEKIEPGATPAVSGSKIKAAVIEARKAEIAAKAIRESALARESQVVPACERTKKLPRALESVAAHTPATTKKPIPKRAWLRKVSKEASNNWDRVWAPL